MTGLFVAGYVALIGMQAPMPTVSERWTIVGLYYSVGSYETKARCEEVLPLTRLNAVCAPLS